MPERIFFDTSVLVAAMIASHPAHEPSAAWLLRARAGEVSGGVSTHSLAELYAVLTRYPLRPRIHPELATRLIHGNLKNLRKVALSSKDYERVMDCVGERNLSGGAIYDALIAHAALVFKAEKLLTLNPKHFVRLGGSVAKIVVVPA